MAEPAWITEARKHIGFHETGNNQGIEEFIAGAHTGSLGDPWCAIFANFSLETAGVKGTRSPAAKSFSESPDFREIDPPRVGAISVFTRVGGNHVGFYTGEDSRGLLILGGNQGDSVCIEHHTRTGLIGFYWPKDVAAAAETSGSSGRGSWYSQHPPDWRDSGDKPGSNALGVPDECQGVSFYNHLTLGHWFQVTAPNGVTSIEQQTEIGPNPNTGRQIDISAVCAAERFKYTKHNFPTDGIFRWHSVPAPAAVASLSPQQQADAYHTLRKGQPMTDTTGPQPQPYQPPSVATAFPQFDLAGIINAIQSKQSYARDSILSIVGIYNALNPGTKINLAGDAPTPSQTAAPVSAAPVAPVAPASPFAAFVNSLGGGSNLSFWTGIAAAFGHIMLNQAGLVGAPAGAGATTAGTLLATGAGSATLAGIFTKLGAISAQLGPIAAKLGPLIALIPK